jgi:transcriptional regulator with XRE-family HTH domain
LANIPYRHDFQDCKGKPMAISDRIRKLRQERHWSQAELGEQLGVHQKQVSAYERGVNLPSTEVLIKLAEVFNVTLDYLAFEAKGQPTALNIQDRELLRRFEEVDTLSDQEKNLAKEILDLVILKHRFHELVGPKAAIG